MKPKFAPGVVCIVTRPDQPVEDLRGRIVTLKRRYFRLSREHGLQVGWELERGEWCVTRGGFIAACGSDVPPGQLVKIVGLLQYMLTPLPPLKDETHDDACEALIARMRRVMWHADEKAGV